MEKQIECYFDRQANWDPAYFDWKTRYYRGNLAISKSFDWLKFQGKSVLDIGCGVGYYAIPLAKHCDHLTGIDLSSENIQLARKYAQRARVTNVTFVKSDLEDFSPNEEFDISYAITVLMHIEDTMGALIKINSSLKPGGYLLISDLNYYFHRRIIPNRQKNAIFMRNFNFKYLGDQLQSSGFRVVKESGRIFSIAGLRKPEWMVMLWLERWAEKWPLKHLGEHIAILAQKE